MRKRPLLFGACVFVAGILYARYGGWYYPAAIAVLLIYGLEKLLREKKWKRLVVRGLWLLGIFVLSMLHMRQELRFREEELSQIQAGEELLLRGEVYKKEYKNGQYVFYLNNCTAVISDMETSCNRVISYLDADTYSIGETLIIKGKVNLFSRASNEGQFDIRAFYESQKIDFALSGCTVIKTDGRKNALGERLYCLREKIGDVYEIVLDEQQEGLLSVMLLGDKTELDSELRALYQAAGISHILAISGLHVSMIGMGVYRFLRRTGRRFGSAFAVSAVFLLLYAAMTGNSVSTLRAVGMLCFFMFAAVLGRSYDPLNALGGMVMLLLWENPFWLWYSGFLFSVVAILGVTIAGAWLPVEASEEGTGDWTESRKEGNTGKQPKSCEEGGMENGVRWRRKAWELLNRIYAGAAVWLATLPLVAFYYYEVPIYSVIINLLALPLMSTLFLCGLAGGLAGCVWLPAARVLLYPCSLILQIYNILANASLKLPFSQVIVGKPNAAKIAAVYLVLLVVIWICYKKRNGHLKRFLGIAVVLFVFFLPDEKEFELDVLDVGQGDGIYICSENGVSMFIDGGSSSSGSVGTYRLLPFLKSKGISHVSYWFVTHADEDHISGLTEVIESGYRIDNLVVAYAALGEEAMDELTALAESYGIEITAIRTGDRLVFQNASFTCIYPEAETTAEDRNELSLVMLYESDQFTGIFTGDISSDVEAEILSSDVLAELLTKSNETGIDFYKAAHHGSKYSNSAGFLSALSPEIAVVSCSSTNTYGHPSAEAVANMEAAGASVYYTMESGQIKLKLDQNDELQVETFWGEFNLV